MAGPIEGLHIGDLLSKHTYNVELHYIYSQVNIASESVALYSASMH